MTNLLKNGFNIPNILTLVRILLIPLIIFCIVQSRYLLGVTIFIMIAITDFLDGFYARRYGQVTQLGSLLDPIADKLLILALYISFYLIRPDILVPKWFLILIFGKEFLLILGAFVLFCKKRLIKVKPTLLAKLLMGVNCLNILILFLGQLLNFLSLDLLYKIYVFIGGLTIVVFLQYFYIFYRAIIKNSIKEIYVKIKK